MGLQALWLNFFSLSPSDTMGHHPRFLAEFTAKYKLTAKNKFYHRLKIMFINGLPIVLNSV
ncbi:MAG: hypothetical protein ACTSYI_09100 [Promethearchaeota archaeon]